MTDLPTALAAVLGTAYRLERELGGGGLRCAFLFEETALRRRVRDAKQRGDGASQKATLH
ncbi:hypothetical protein GEMMAAP_01880 [Gemmatimonas phototrophica]|uniref:Uncharacterized protein n=1 Tax=Gemmatimonas phototrophica TaxID=1379270 RepID=A0A143BHJ9_9BACT|nr:hypothetical protein GEMMAAP_01880 [Gemmatimonas phototrophica]